MTAIRCVGNQSCKTRISDLMFCKQNGFPDLQPLFRGKDGRSELDDLSAIVRWQPFDGNRKAARKTKSVYLRNLTFTVNVNFLQAETYAASSLTRDHASRSIMLHTPLYFTQWNHGIC